MALTATIHAFEIELADTDRGVYETLSLRAARHPSETEESLITRVLAYCLEYTEGIGFANGLPGPDEPAIAVRDLTGALRVWIDVGAPDAARLHKAGKAAPRVAVYTHKDPVLLVRQWSRERIHRADQLELYSFGRALRDGLLAHLKRRTVMALTVAGGQLHVTIEGEVIEGRVERHELGRAGDAR
ncbi:MAG TPA: YaeQ family protein [Patescibacteria group bacterium]|nr:YaeQ family protein [Patescibacteria group bacterium]